MSTTNNNKKRKTTTSSSPPKRQNLVEQSPIPYTPYREPRPANQQLISQNTLPMPQPTQPIPLNSTQVINAGNIQTTPNIQQQQQDQPSVTEEQALLKEIAEKRKARAIKTKPENIHLIKPFDEISMCTNADLLFLNWSKDHIFEELVGIVCYVKRGLTSKNKWDRTDILIQVGKPDEREKVAVFGWGAQAAVLEGAELNNFIRLTNMIVVPEDIGKRDTWNGSIEFKLKFTRSSTLTIVEQGQSAVSQQNTNMIEEGPSTSATILNPHVGNVQNYSYASNATSAVDRDVEYEVVAPSAELSQQSLHAESNPQRLYGNPGHTPPAPGIVSYVVPPDDPDAIYFRGERSIHDIDLPKKGLNGKERNILLASRVQLAATYKSKEEDPLCGVCVRDFMPKQSVIFLPCSHKLHKTCFWDLSRFYRHCPTCKYDMGRGLQIPE
uniref:RING-type domain-containing protein n=2 Tax=Meloidogyne enterolobii TaxID=390850 RepID=A0A6V7XWR5_MELEN|nr:unnamed protein product [Meloidogyne enterolobii]